MNSRQEIDHSVLQKLIIITLGLMTVGVILQSCSSHTSCAAYDNVEVTTVAR